MNLPVTVTITEARRNLEALVERAERGETFLITRRGKPVGYLVPKDLGRALKTSSGADTSANQL